MPGAAAGGGGGAECWRRAPAPGARVGAGRGPSSHSPLHLLHASRSLSRPLCPPPPTPRLPPPRSELCSFLDIDGVRGDITINKAVRAFVAFEGRTRATTEDLERIAPLVLNHRCAVCAVCAVCGVRCVCCVLVGRPIGWCVGR